MNILPDRNTFDRLAASSPRVPVCGQQKIPGLDLSNLFQKLLLNTENTFLFESGKGPEETARYSLMGSASSKIIEIKDANHWIHVSNPDNLLKEIKFFIKS